MRSRVNQVNQRGSKYGITLQMYFFTAQIANFVRYDIKYIRILKSSALHQFRREKDINKATHNGKNKCIRFPDFR